MRRILLKISAWPWDVRRKGDPKQNSRRQIPPREALSELDRSQASFRVRNSGFVRPRLERIPIMNPSIKTLRDYYRLLVNGANYMQSPLLLILRVYFFCQLFVIGEGKLNNIGKIAGYFSTLGIPLPLFNAYLAGATETFGSLFIIVGLVSRLASIPVAFSMMVAYLTAESEAVKSLFFDPDKFVKADPFPYLICALILIAFGPGKLSIDALLKRKFDRED
jgi:putative oxidoreductase